MTGIDKMACMASILLVAIGFIFIARPTPEILFVGGPVPPGHPKLPKAPVVLSAKQTRVAGLAMVITGGSLFAVIRRFPSKKKD